MRRLLLVTILFTSCTLERVGQQQLLNPGAEAIYRDWHYSQAVRVDDLIFVSGQVAPGDDIETQARGAFEKLRTVLAAGGASLSDVVELTTFHTDMTEFERFAKVKDEYFPRNYPAWTARRRDVAGGTHGEGGGAGGGGAAKWAGVGHRAARYGQFPSSG